MKRNGFTLIELLAVIVILAIIALIATPIVLNIINSAKDSANKISVELYCSAVKNAVIMKSIEMDVPSGTYTTLDSHKFIINNEEMSVDYEGNDVNCTLEIEEDGNIKLTNCKVDNVSVDYGCNNGEVVEVEQQDSSCFTAVANANQDGAIITSYTCDSKDVVIPDTFEVNILKTFTFNETKFRQENCSDMDEDECNSIVDNTQYKIIEDKVGAYKEFEGYGALDYFNVEFEDVELPVVGIKQNVLKDKNIKSITYDGKTATSSKLLGNILVKGEKNNLYAESLIGSKHLVAVNSSTSYNFYVLSKNNDNTVNLILDRNICSDGTLITSEKNCRVEWLKASSYNIEESGSVLEGPTTALEYLKNATSTWTNIDYNYSDVVDINGKYSNISLSGYHARLPKRSEVSSYNGTNAYLYDNFTIYCYSKYEDGHLLTADQVNCETYSPIAYYEGVNDSTISHIYVSNNHSYWTSDTPDCDSSSVCDIYSEGWVSYHVNYEGVVELNYVFEQSGIRPVITVPISMIN